MNSMYRGSIVVFLAWVCSGVHSLHAWTARRREAEGFAAASHSAGPCEGEQISMAAHVRVLLRSPMPGTAAGLRITIRPP